MVFFRVDASLLIGFGHLRRIISLAKEIKKSGEHIAFICTGVNKNSITNLLNDFNVHYINSSSCEQDSHETSRIIQQYDINPSILVVDSYPLNLEWDQMIKDQLPQIKLVVIDDILRERNCDLYINTGIIEYTLSSHALDSDKNYILGPKYSLVDESFIQKRKKANFRSRLSKVLVCFGGTDVTGETEKLLNALILEPLDLEFDVILNPSIINLESSFPYIKNNLKINFYQDCNDLSEFMLNADIAVGSFGSMCFERCVMKLPSINVITSSEQRQNESLFVKAGANISVGEHDSNSGIRIVNELKKIVGQNKILNKMSIATSCITDGTGKKIIAERILKLN